MKRREFYISTIVEMLKSGKDVWAYQREKNISRASFWRYKKEAEERLRMEQRHVEGELLRREIEQRAEIQKEELLNIYDLKVKLQRIIENEELNLSARLKAIDTYARMIGAYVLDNKENITHHEIRFEFNTLPAHE